MKDLLRFKNSRAGQTVVLIGNGPSLKQEHLDALAWKYETFGSNKIYRLPFTPTYYAIIDEDMMDACLPLPQSFTPKEMFIRAEAGVGTPIYPIVAAGFSLDPANFVVMGGTVTYAMLQILYYMGVTTVLLIGVDHHYPKAGGLIQGGQFVALGPDPDHFVCADGLPYFDEGKVFNAPELDGTTQAYMIAKELFDKSGRQIINLTPDTKLDVFNKDKLENWL